MAFFKFRKRGAQVNEGRNASVAATPAESVEAMRRRARHRLLGAAVLVLVGVIGFPLLFDTQPRPVAVDIPIEIPDRNKAKPLPLPGAAPTATAPGTSSSGNPPSAPVAQLAPSTRVPPASSGPRAGGEVITEDASGAEISPSRPVNAAPPEDTRPNARAEPKPEAKPAEPRAQAKAPEHKPESKPEPKPDAKIATAKPTDDAARARALLEGKTASSAQAKPAATEEAGRFIVQVGAFAESGKASEVRQKLERAGLKTFTSVVKTGEGERTRVRVGPFASRAEADRAAGKVKGLSLPAAVIGL